MARCPSDTPRLLLLRNCTGFPVRLSSVFTAATNRSLMISSTEKISLPAPMIGIGSDRASTFRKPIPRGGLSSPKRDGRAAKSRYLRLWAP
jgi:hypothetical protein